MDINLSIGASRRLSVDIANLSFRLAMLESEREAMTQLVMQLTPGMWERSYSGPPSTLVMDPDEVSPGITEWKPEEEPWATIRGDQIQLLDRLIMMFHELV